MVKLPFFKEQDTNPDAYKISCYALRRTIKQAKRQYRTKIESYNTGSDARRMLQVLQIITDYKGKHSQELPSGRFVKVRCGALDHCATR